MKTPPDCKWTVGFYPIQKDVNGQLKLDFLVIPTLVNNKTKEIYDFGDPKNDDYYKKTSPTVMVPSGSTGYDSGQLWP